MSITNRHHFVLLFLFSCLFTTSTWAVVQDLEPLRDTPADFKNAANQFEQKKSRALKSVESALKKEGQNGTSKIDTLVGNVQQLAAVATANMSKIESALDKHEGPARSAMEDLLGQYRKNMALISKAKNSAAAMLNLHQSTRGIIEYLEIEKENSQRRLANCSARAELITRFVSVVGTKMLKQTGSTTISDAIKNAHAHEILAETLAVFVYDEKQKIDKLLDEVNPARELGKLRTAGDGLNGSPGSWDDAHDRWRVALVSHSGGLNSAVRDFKSRVEAPWKRFYIGYANAKVESLKGKVRELTSLRDRMRLEESKEIQEQLRNLDKTQEVVQNTNQKIDRLRAELATLLARQALLKIQIREAAKELDASAKRSAENQEDDVEKRIDEVSDLLKDHNETLEAALKAFDEIRAELKQSNQ